MNPTDSPLPGSTPNNPEPIAPPEPTTLPPQGFASPTSAQPPTLVKPEVSPAAAVTPESVPTDSISPAATNLDMPAEPTMPGAVVTSGSNVASPMTTNVNTASFGSKKSKKKPLLIAAVAVILLLLLGGGYVFAFYIPNKPANIWNQALVNTGKAYDKLSTYATTSRDSKGLSVDGKFKLKGALVADGSFSGKSVGQNGQLTGDFSASGLKIGYDVRTLKSATGDTPDLYFKVTGLQGLGGLVGGGSPEIAAALNGVDSQWFVVDHTLFEQFNQSAATTQISQADVATFLKTAGKPSKEYLFTGDKTKAVIVNKQQIGREKKDGRSVYHYKAGIDQQHFKSYLTALCSSLKSDKIGKMILDTEGSSCDAITKYASTNTTTTADVWVDTRTKLIHTVRFAGSNPSSYIDIGQDYQGGSVYPFSIGLYDKSGSTTTNGTLKLSLDSKANTLKVDGQFSSKGSSASDNETGSLTMSVGLNGNGSLQVDKPANAKTLIQLLDSLGLGQFLGGSVLPATGSDTGSLSIQTEARDTKRKTDIRALQSQLEAYFAQKGAYPTLANMNSASWRATNMKGLDSTTLKDPQGSSSDLAAKPAAHVYAYQVAGDGNSYTLTATLEAGGTFARDSLN